MNLLKKMIRKQAYYLASVVFIVLGLIYSIISSDQPYIGLNIENIKGQWLIAASDPGGEGYRAGMRVGNIILKINGDSPNKYSIANKWGETEGASSIVFRGSDQSTGHLITFPMSTAGLRNFNEIPLQILGFVFWLLGFMTWIKRPFLVQARALFWANWIIALAIIFVPASSRCLCRGRELEYISLSLVPIFLIHLVSVFPKETKTRLNRFSRYLFVMIAMIIIIWTLLQAGGFTNRSGSLSKLLISTVTIALLITLGNLGSLIMLPKDHPERNQAGILFGGILIGFFPFVLLTAVPQLMDFQPLMYFDFSSLFFSVIPFTWYFVIVNKYLPDSRRFLMGMISFFIMGVIVNLVALWILFNLRVVKTINLQAYLALLSLTMSLMVCFYVVQFMLNHLLERTLFCKVKQGFHKSIFKLNKMLSSMEEYEQVLEEVIKSLAIEGALIVVEDGKGRGYKKAVGRFSGESKEQAKLEEYFQTVPKVDSEAKILPDDFPAEVYIPLLANDYIGGIFLGHRYSKVKIDRDELPLVTLISSQLAQRLITKLVLKEWSVEIKDLVQRSQSDQRKIQRLQRITRSFFKNFEQEKKALARDLHDGPLQLALDLNRWLDEIAEECLNNKVNHAPKAIAHMKEVIRNLNFELRSICSDLRPQSLNDLGLLSAVQIMCEEREENEFVEISLEPMGFSEEVRLKEEIELTAYRFFQEGTTNAIKHSGSKEITLKIELKDSELELIVRDYGKGLDMSQIETGN